MDESARTLEERIHQAWTAGDLAGAATCAIEGYGPEIMGFLYALARSETAAGDAFSMFCEDLWRGLASFRWESSFRTWAYTLARNALHRLRRRPAAQTVALTPLIEQLAAPVRTTTLSYLRTERKDQLARLRAGLDEDDRTLLILRVDRGLSWSEVAKVMAGEGGDGPTAAALRKRFERIKRRIARQLRAAAPGP